MKTGKFFKTMLVAAASLACILFYNASTATAAQYQVDVSISNLATVDIEEYVFGLNYDTDVLTYVSYSIPTTGPGEYEIGTGIEDISSGGGGLVDIEILPISGQPAVETQSNEFTMATITFESNDGTDAVIDALSGLYFSYIDIFGYNHSDGSYIDEELNFIITKTIVATNEGISTQIDLELIPTATPVPVPTAFYLMTIGFVSLAGLTRKNS